MYQTKTIRRLPHNARKLARTLNDLDVSLRALKRLLLTVEEMEREAHAFQRHEARLMEAALERTGDPLEDGRRALEDATVRRLA